MNNGKGRSTIDQLIINSPYGEPKEHWQYDPETKTFSREPNRRKAGYVVATPGARSFEDPGIFVEIPLVNQIRPRVNAWRENGYPGVTSITKRLLEHWYDEEEFENRRLFFCQLEAMETLIWLAEAPAADKVGINVSSDGGPFQRLCSKLATGTGKTIVMAMVIAWQVLNKVTSPQDKRYSKQVLVIAPGLTVKSRLQVLATSGDENYYQEFSVVPASLMDKLRQGKVRIINWHKLNWDTEERVAKKKSVDKRGAKSDEAYVREVLDEMSNARNILVINDEAHHAWRVPAESKLKGITKDELEEATKWVGGLDRINKARGILTAYDFSATPFAPTGKKSSEEGLFDWIVSDFGLNDAIESGLVKTPRIVIRDDALPNPQTYRSRLYHIYMDKDVHDDLNRKAKPEDPLPDLVGTAYYLLGYDWLETSKAWQAQGHTIPPVMITVCNRTETAARIKYSFEHKRIRIDELCDTDRLLHIDSKVLEMAESMDEPISAPGKPSDSDEDEGDAVEKKLTRKEQAELLRRQVDTVGQPGQPGEQIQKVISVGMLSEGWDAKTVTHIMGLRAFSSQLLCEQVVGRGLRRTSYEVNPKTNLFEPEYVNIFGVPFTFLPHEGGENGPQPPPPPRTLIEPIRDKRAFEISWPNIIRINHSFRHFLKVDWKKVQPLKLNASETPQIAELAPMVDGQPDASKIAEIDLENLARKFRTQKIVFETARDVFDQMKEEWKGGKEILIAQLVRIVEEFMKSDKIHITPELFYQDELKQRLMITLNMTKVVQHVVGAIGQENTTTLEPVFDKDHPIRSTEGMQRWYTGKPTEYTKKSHINRVVLDSTWESMEAYAMDKSKLVDAWAKNDHLGFEVLYIHNGVVRKYRPDFIIKVKSGKHLVLETKGQNTERDKTKRRFLEEWVEAVNHQGGFGKWDSAVSFDPGDVLDILEKHKN